MVSKIWLSGKVALLLAALALVHGNAQAADDVTVKPVDGGYVVTCSVQAQRLYLVADGAQVAVMQASSAGMVTCADVVVTEQPVASWSAWSETCTEDGDTLMCSAATLLVYSRFSYLPIAVGGR
jgi:hypothetical protein